jgi:hypothetical protein
MTLTFVMGAARTTPIASKIIGLAGDLTKRSTFFEMRLERPEAIQCVIAFAASYDASSSLLGALRPGGL